MLVAQSRGVLSDHWYKGAMKLPGSLVACLIACAPTAPAPQARPAPWAPQDVPEDRQPAEPPKGPTSADGDVAEIDRNAASMRARYEALVHADAGTSPTASCVADKLGQIDSARRSAEDRRDSLRAASARGDTDLSQRELAIVQALAKRSSELVVEASACR